MLYSNNASILGKGILGGQHGPFFVQISKGNIKFSNRAGVRLDCKAHGLPQPRVEWVYSDWSSVTNYGELRKLLTNGSLHFSSFRRDEYIRDVHDKDYYCLAHNTAGTAISQPIHVKAGKCMPKFTMMV